MLQGPAGKVPGVHGCDWYKQVPWPETVSKTRYEHTNLDFGVTLCPLRVTA